MTADIFASLQTYPDPQALGQVITNTSPENADSQAGVFSALMDEYASLNDAGEILEQGLLPIAQEAEEQMMTFKSGNSFVRPIIEFLGEGTSEPEIAPASDETLTTSDEGVIWPEDEALPNNSELGRTVKKLLSKVKDAVSENLQDTELQDIAEQVIADEGLDDIPDTLKQEIAYAINDIAAALRHDDGKDSQSVVKMLGAISERIAPKVEAVQPKTDDDSQESDTLDNITDFTGYAVITNFTPQEESPLLRKERSDEVAISSLRKGGREGRLQGRSGEDTPLNPPLDRAGLQAISSLHNGDQEGLSQVKDDVPESQERTQTFRDVFMNRDSQQEDSGQNQNQGFSQSRSRTNTRQIDSPTQADDSAANRRTDSHSDFAAYFEGVLTSRRTVSRTSPAPLDLRGTENFTQSSGVRDGITNVVRFIRADGMHKARVVVDPPALGRISVELTSGTSGVEASIKVSSEQIRQLVQDQLSELRMNLSQQGVQVAEFTVDVQQDNSGSQNQQGQQNNPYMNFFADDEDSETEEFRIDLEDGLLYWVA